MYGIAGLLVERISGKKWEAFLGERLFTPLGMRETLPLVADVRGKPDVAVPHARVRDTIRAVPYRSTDVVASAGSVYSSVADMTRWLRFMLDSGRIGSRRLISAETFDDIVTPQINVDASQYPALELARPSHFSYGLGWFIQDYNGEPVWMHTGSIDGMSAIVGLLPRRKVGVVVLANLDHVELRHALMYQVFDLFTDGPNRDWSRDLKRLFDERAAAARTAQARQTPPATSAGPSLPLERYAGSYGDSAYGAVEIRHEGGALHLRYGNLDAGRLEHVNHEVFRARPTRPSASPTTVTFLPDGTGGVSAVRLFGVTFARTRR